MKLFKLPDLGEGLPDAIIRKWYVKVGDPIEKDQPMVAMETAKALVDVPAPFTGVVEKLFGAPGDTIETGKSLIGFEGEGDANESKQDTGTVVGKLEQSEQNVSIKNTVVTKEKTIQATPAARTLARKLNVNLEEIATGTLITEQNVYSAAKKTTATAENHQTDWESLSNVKRAMMFNMTHSHQEIVPVTLLDDVDIHAWQEKQDITLRIIDAIITACKKEPALNAHFDGKNLRIKKFSEIHLGLAIDMPHGLYVPVLRDVACQSGNALRHKMDQLKQQAKQKSIAQTDLHGATIVLSNFGAIAGRYANPIILPPTVAIVGVGRITSRFVPDENNKPALHRVIPLSLTVDHRAITGGEAARFLRTMMDALSSAS